MSSFLGVIYLKKSFFQVLNQVNFILDQLVKRSKNEKKPINKNFVNIKLDFPRNLYHHFIY